MARTPTCISVLIPVANRARYDRIHVAAGYRHGRHIKAGYSKREAWDRFDRVMDFAFDFLAVKGA